MGKAIFYYIILLLLALGSVCFVIFRNSNFDDPYSKNNINEVMIDGAFPGYELKGYQSRIASVNGEEINADQFAKDTYAALLINRDTRETIVSHNALRRIYPASTTKLMTGLVVCDALNEGKISLDQVVTLTHDTVIDDPDAVMSNLKAGYSVTVRNLIYGLMMRSYNDYAIILAELVGGDVSTFCEMMNQKAYSIGATGSHFANPHGLHNDNHYITAYDMYLILNEASKYDILKEIDGYSSFSYTYTDNEGYEHTDDISATNQFLAGSFTLPSNITIHEWKTGTTDAAGNILTMNFEIDNSNYALFVADGTSPDDLYDKIGIMFNLTK